MIFEKRHSEMLKGIAILMMMFHHLFGFRSWIADENMYHCIFAGNTILFAVASYCKVCVGIFIFITGYALYLKKENYLDLCGRVFRFLKKYWIIYFLFILIGWAAREPLPGITIAIRQMFGFSTMTGYGGGNESIHPVFAWYVSIYITFILTAPLWQKLCRYNPMTDFILCFGLANTVSVCLRNQDIIPLSSTLRSFIFLYASYVPVGMLGYIFAKYSVFGKIKVNQENNVLSLCFLILILVISVIIRFSLQERFGLYISMGGVSFDFIFIMINILCWQIITEKYLKPVLKYTLSFLGKHSNNMWLLHGLLFTPNKTFQGIFYSLKYPFLIFVFSVIFILGMSVIIEKTERYVYDLIHQGRIFIANT